MKFPRMLIDGVVLMALLTALCLLPASPARGQAVSGSSGVSGGTEVLTNN